MKNPTQPYNQDIQQQVSYQVTAKPVFSGCIKKNGRYYGYTQQGTLLDVTQSDCKRLIENGDRPFNYFRTETVSTVTTPVVTTQQEQPSKQQLAQTDQAKQQGLI
ncbi:hypothetical protein [Acinetobacter ursingii]|uniref:hypothetical protein n=1 Tax=Acinetobacter ursingii TaxID=108980 RepID=UPI00124FD562|nr:hypothetical protein [Acinetobacter ursingii]